MHATIDFEFEMLNNFTAETITLNHLFKQDSLTETKHFFGGGLIEKIQVILRVMTKIVSPVYALMRSCLSVLIATNPTTEVATTKGIRMYHTT